MTKQIVPIESKHEFDDKKTATRKRERNADRTLRRLANRVVSIQDIENEDQWDELLDSVD